MRLTRLLALVLSMVLVASACGDDAGEVDFTPVQAWCIGLVDGIAFSAGTDLGDDILRTTLDECVSDEVPTSSGGFETPFLLLTDGDAPDDAYCRGRIAGDLGLLFSVEAQEPALQACLAAKPLANSENRELARAVFGG
ncbi:hypothetical protein HQ535_10115 [bacterium]|nr:hypothetical protein [bacterium]